MPPLKTVQTKDRILNQIQGNVQQAIQQVLANPVLNGHIISDIELVMGSNSINHGLGRELEGWIIVRQRSQADIWDSQDDNSTPQYTLDLDSDANTVVDLYVF